MDASLLQRIDFLRLAIDLGGNQATIRKMLKLYLDVAAQLLRDFERAEQQQDIHGWMQIAHRLKGASMNITAKRLAGLCNEAEEITALPHPQAEAVIYHMHKELAILRESIAKHLKEPL